MSTPKSHASRFVSYKNALNALSARTGTPLPSLVLSFTILHECTAVIPLVGVFFVSRQLELGERFVNRFIPNNTSSDQPRGWLGQQFKRWVDEGEHWAERVGRRYGIFGFVKGSSPNSTGDDDQPRWSSKTIAGDVANAALAYGIVKALLPARIGLSLYLAPAFSRRVVRPLHMGIFRLFKKN